MNDIGDDGATALFGALADVSSLKKLDLSGWSSIVGVIRFEQGRANSKMVGLLPEF